MLVIEIFKWWTLSKRTFRRKMFRKKCLGKKCVEEEQRYFVENYISEDESWDEEYLGLSVSKEYWLDECLMVMCEEEECLSRGCWLEKFLEESNMKESYLRIIY
jgi:hypothetical protein